MSRLPEGSLSSHGSQGPGQANGIFGGVEALRVSLPSLGVTIFPQLLIALPYLAALLALTIIGRSNRQPKELGKDFNDQL